MENRSPSRSGTRSGGTLRAFVLSPLGTVGVLSLWSVLTHAEHTGSYEVQDTVSIVAIFILVSYFATLLVGVPIFLFLRRSNWTSQTACVLGGGASGLIFFLIPYSIWYGFSTTVGSRGPEMIASTAAGMATG